MFTPNLYLIYSLIFIAVVLFIEGLYFLYSSTHGRHKAINTRLKLMAEGHSGQELLKLLRRERTISLPFLHELEHLLLQSGINIPFYRFFTYILLLCAIAIGATYVLLLQVFPAIMAGILVFVTVCLALMVKRKVRLRTLAQQLPNAIDIVVRSLRAGHPVPASLSMVAREMADPIGTEFGIVVDEMTYGLDLNQALHNLADRVGLPDMQFLTVSVSIQSNVGGNLAEVLGNLSRVIRSRHTMKLKIKALSAEGRFTAGLLTILPPVLYLILSTVNSTYFEGIIQDPLFYPIAYTGLGLYLLGSYTMYRMVNFRI